MYRLRFRILAFLWTATAAAGQTTSSDTQTLKALLAAGIFRNRGATSSSAGSGSRRATPNGAAKLDELNDLLDHYYNALENTGNEPSGRPQQAK
jgi:hypothetical protein